MTIETANRLYELRKQQGLSQEELAEKLGVSRQAVSKWERSEASPDTDNLIALAKLYGLSLDELIYGKKSGKDEQQGEERTKEEQKKDESTPDCDGKGHRIETGPTNIIINDENGETIKIGIDGIKIDTNDDDDDDFDDLYDCDPSEEFDEFEDPEDSFDDDDDDDDETTFINNGKSKIKVTPTRIVIEDKKGETVQIDLNGIKIGSKKTGMDGSGKQENVNIDSDGEIHIDVKKDKKEKGKFWFEFPYPILCLAAYLIFGVYNICGGWAHSWIIFVTIPIYFSIVEAIYKRRLSLFAYPVLMAFVYLYLGLYHGNWHPSWVIFLTVPIFYWVSDIQKKARKKKERTE